MTKSSRARALLLASAIAIAPAAAFAQETNAVDPATVNATTTNAVDPATVNTTATTNMDSMDTMGTTAAPATDTLANDLALAETVQPERDDDDFPWDLLGLLGLAGLLGLKRKDDDRVRTTGTIDR